MKYSYIVYLGNGGQRYRDLFRCFSSKEEAIDFVVEEIYRRSEKTISKHQIRRHFESKKDNKNFRYDEWMCYNSHYISAYPEIVSFMGIIEVKNG